MHSPEADYYFRTLYTISNLIDPNRDFATNYDRE
jgi:hypothetical protein